MLLFCKANQLRFEMNPFINRVTAKKKSKFGDITGAYGEAASYYNNQFDQIQVGVENARPIRLLRDHTPEQARNYISKYMRSVKVKKILNNHYYTSKHVDGYLWIAILEYSND